LRDIGALETTQSRTALQRTPDIMDERKGVTKTQTQIEEMIQEIPQMEGEVAHSPNQRKHQAIIKIRRIVLKKGLLSAETFTAEDSICIFNAL